MPDLEDRVRELLERRAADVGPRLEVPPTLVRRARWRFVAYAAVTCVVAVAVVAGAAAAWRALPEAPVDHPGDTGAETPGACVADQLAASAPVEGAMGSVDGTITLTNASASTCELSGRPSFSLLEPSGDPVTSGIRFMPREGPAGRLTLAPGQTSTVTYGWSNWCLPDQPTWVMEAPGGGPVPIADLGPEMPPCNGPGQPSIVEYGPYEVASTP